MRALGLSIDAILGDNDAYHALKASGNLIVTGTNVNDLSVLLVQG